MATEKRAGDDDEKINGVDPDKDEQEILQPQIGRDWKVWNYETGKSGICVTTSNQPSLEQESAPWSFK